MQYVNWRSSGRLSPLSRNGTVVMATSSSVFVCRYPVASSGAPSLCAVNLIQGQEFSCPH
jgi:hypothetical protein